MQILNNIEITSYRQHDSQEFLIYLLDGLHADINKGIVKKELTKDEQSREDRLPLVSG